MACSEITQQVKEAGIIAIIRGSFALADMQRIAEALQAGGVRVMEVTLNSSDALKAITRLRKRNGDDLLVGAGTVRTAPQVEKALAAGAQFIVS
ncbi:MAG: 2-dehydro-3-deoxyphosphogluconate aldolase, partial [Anaerolineae bacterium]